MNLNVERCWSLTSTDGIQSGPLAIGLYVGRGRGSADWLGIGTETGKMYGVDSMQTSSVEGKM